MSTITDNNMFSVLQSSKHRKLQARANRLYPQEKTPELLVIRPKKFTGIKIPLGHTPYAETIRQLLPEEKKPDPVNQNLHYTQPCNSVVRDEHGNFGKCTRSYCTYAHTKKQFRYAQCFFDTKCKNGNKCSFKHSDETDQDYRERRHLDLPDLPTDDEAETDDQ